LYCAIKVRFKATHALASLGLQLRLFGLSIVSISYRIAYRNRDIDPAWLIVRSRPPLFKELVRQVVNNG